MSPGPAYIILSSLPCGIMKMCLYFWLYLIVVLALALVSKQLEFGQVCNTIRKLIYSSIYPFIHSFIQVAWDSYLSKTI